MLSFAFSPVETAHVNHGNGHPRTKLWEQTSASALCLANVNQHKHLRVLNKNLHSLKPRPLESLGGELTLRSPSTWGLKAALSRRVFSSAAHGSATGISQPATVLPEHWAAAGKFKLLSCLLCQQEAGSTPMRTIAARPPWPQA